MTAPHLVKTAVSKPDFKQERLLPLFPQLAGYQLVWNDDILTIKIFLPNLPQPEDASALYPKYPGLPAKIKISGQAVRFTYHNATELPKT